MKKRFAMVTVFLVLAGGSLTGVLAAEEQKGPRIEIPQDRVNIGKVKQGEAAVHVFEFKNIGDETLVINKVETTWGCSAALVSSDRLEPGATGQLKLTVATQGRMGPMMKAAGIYSNDRTNPVKTMTLIMEIVAP